MTLKDIWIYVCTATIAKKYIVASEAIVRTNAENLSAALSRYVYKAMTRNADRSKCTPRSAIEFRATIRASVSTYRTRCPMTSELA